MENMVRVYNPNTKAVSEIPSSELAPGMMLCEMEGVGLVYVHHSHIKIPEGRRHEELNEECNKAATIAYQILSGVSRFETLEKWLDGFLEDTHPNREIGVWLRLAGTYEMYSAGRPKEVQQDTYNLLVACSVSSRSDALHVVTPKRLSKSRARSIRDAFFDFDMEARFGDLIDAKKMAKGYED